MSTELQLPEGVPPLSTYYLYMTGACNLACRHCWITPEFVRENNDGVDKCLPFDLYELSIREGEPLGLKNLKFTGGEPFVHPDVQRMLDYATKRELGIMIETNGTLITKSIAHYLHAKTTVRFISVSIDGASADSHDYMRGVPGSFERTKAGVRYLVEAGFHPQIIMSLHEGNIDEIEPLTEWAASAGCSSVKLNIIQETGRGAHFEGRLRKIIDLIELGHWVESDLQSRIAIPIYYSWPPAFQSLRHLRMHGGCFSCNVCNILGILHTGHMSLCGIGTQDTRLVYGLIGETSIKDVWISHPFIVQMRESIPNELKGICGNCLLRDTCMGHCVADNFQRSGDVCASYWFCELADQMELFPTQRKRQQKSATVSVA